jgi:hypothetical protein
MRTDGAIFGGRGLRQEGVDAFQNMVGTRRLELLTSTVSKPVNIMYTTT